MCSQRIGVVDQTAGTQKADFQKIKDCIEVQRLVPARYEPELDGFFPEHRCELLVTAVPQNHREANPFLDSTRRYLQALPRDRIRQAQPPRGFGH